MVKRLVKVPFVNMRVMFPRDENRKDVTFKMRRGASFNVSSRREGDSASVADRAKLCKHSWAGEAGVVGEV